jgi:mannose-6-phosphate isomerase
MSSSQRKHLMAETKKIMKPWGYEMIWAETDKYVGKTLHIHQGEKLSLQFHKEKDETIMLLSGKMLFEYFKAGEKSQTIELNPEDKFHIAPNLRHRMIAIEDCIVVEVSTPQLDDIVRLEDSYGRK